MSVTQKDGEELLKWLRKELAAFPIIRLRFRSLLQEIPSCVHKYTVQEVIEFLDDAMSYRRI